MFRAYFSDASGDARPSGQATWSVTGASGTTVPCMGGNVDTIRRSGVITCVVARQQLEAAESPYSVSVNYPGSDGFTAASAVVMQPVSPANSQTWLNFTPATSSGGSFAITASVWGQAPWPQAPTGNVTFVVSDSTGQSISCQGGDTVPLSSGQATCDLASTSTTDAVLPLTVTATYGGDSNFDSSMSQVGTINHL
jgi:large repetitive protein